MRDGKSEKSSTLLVFLAKQQCNVTSAVQAGNRVFLVFDKEEGDLKAARAIVKVFDRQMLKIESGIP